VVLLLALFSFFFHKDNQTGQMGFSLIYLSRKLF
jgi:hypothetical protein